VQANAPYAGDAALAPGAQPPKTSDAREKMAGRLGTEAEGALYTPRQQTIEWVFGIINPVMSWRQMSLRGLRATAA
jgi:hypothetical protein